MSSPIAIPNSPKPFRREVRERDLYRRINRKLRPRGEKLRKPRNPRTKFSIGRYYVIDVYRNALIHRHVNLQELAQELGVFYPGEMLSQG